MKITYAEHLPDGGWQCKVRDCRVQPMPRRDIETHLEHDHHIQHFGMVPPSMDFIDTTDLVVNMYRMGGAI